MHGSLCELCVLCVKNSEIGFSFQPFSFFFVPIRVIPALPKALRRRARSNSVLWFQVSGLRFQLCLYVLRDLCVKMIGLCFLDTWSLELDTWFL